MFLVFLMFLIGLGAIVGAIMFAADLNFIVQIGLVVIGVLFIAGAAYIAMYRKYYKIAEVNEAIIRSGGFGKAASARPVVAMRRGLWCIPLIHRFKRFTFKQYVLPIDKLNEQALLCMDSLLANVRATFKVGVNPTDEDVLKFIDAVGDRPLDDEETMRVLCFDTLETSLRDACTSKEYQQVFEGRELVGNEIENSVADDFSKIGLTLSSAKLRDVDPTPREFYQENNPQHAVGLTKIVKIIEEQRLAKEKKQLITEQALRNEQVTTQKEILKLNQEEEVAKSGQGRTISIKQAQDQRAAEEERITSEEAVGKREVLKNQAVELAERDKAIQISEADAKAATAQEKTLVVLKKKAEAEEAVETTKATQKAEREGQVALIAAQKKAEEELVTAQRAADAEAYEVTAKAKADMEAAENAATAKMKEADADKYAKVAAADGERAKQMIPVEVERERVEVLKDELKAKTDFQEAGIKLELSKFEIEKKAEVQVAAANAVAQLSSKAKMNLYGTPEMLASTVSGMTKAFGITSFIEAMVRETPDEVVELAKGGLSKIAGIVSDIAKSFGVKEANPELIEQMIQTKLNEMKTTETKPEDERQAES